MIEIQIAQQELKAAIQRQADVSLQSEAALNEAIRTSSLAALPSEIPQLPLQVSDANNLTQEILPDSST